MDMGSNINGRRNFLMQVALYSGGLFLNSKIVASNSVRIKNESTTGKYTFDKTIPREVLENFLARSLHMLQLSESKEFDEDMRMIKNVGAKHIGRVAAIWWDSNSNTDIENHFKRAKEAAVRLHRMDPEIMLQSCIFETVGKGINNIPMSAWIFEEFMGDIYLYLKKTLKISC